MHAFLCNFLSLILEKLSLGTSSTVSKVTCNFVEILQSLLITSACIFVFVYVIDMRILS